MSILSAMPLAIFPIVEAVAGAISKRSAHTPKSPWLCHVPSLAEKNSLMPGFPVRADYVTGVINSFPAGVMAICTSAPFILKARVM